MKFKNYLFIFILIINLINCQIYSIDHVEITDVTYFSKYNDSLNGCNTTLLIKVDLKDNLAKQFPLDNFQSTDPSIILDSVVTNIFKNDSIAIFQLTCLNTNINLKQLSIEGKSTANSSIIQIFGNIKELSCNAPPTNLGVKVNYTNSIPIDRANDFLFEVALYLENVANILFIDFMITSDNTAFSLEYEKLSNIEYILKFKIANATNLTDNQIIKITPKNQLSTSAQTSFSSFTINPIIKRSLNNQYSDIKYYAWSDSNEKYGYYLFNVKNDNNFVPMVGYNSETTSIDDSLKHLIKTAYPISGNQTDLTFIGYFKAPVYTPNLVQDVFSFFSSNENQTEIHTSYPVSPPFNTGFTGSLQSSSVDGPYYLTTYYSIYSEETGNDVPFPYSYSMQTILDWKYQNDYYPHYCIKEYTPSSIVFSHETYAPQYFFNGKPNLQYSRKASFSGNPYQDVSIGTVSNSIDPNIENIPPIISDIKLIPLIGYGYNIRFTIQYTSAFTFSYLKINGQVLTALNMAASGIVEKLVNESFVISMRDSFTILICDTIYSCNEKTYYPKTFNSLGYIPFPSLVLPNYEIINIFDIQSLYFQSSTISLSDQSLDNRANKVFLKVNTASNNYPIYFKLNKFSKDLRPFKFNSKLGLYECSFTVPKNYINGKLNYFIVLNDKEYSYSSLYSLVGGANSTVTVQQSATVDVSPPFVTSIVSFPSSQVEISTTVTHFGWEIEIKDQANGFEYGEINITSTLNPVPRTYKIKPQYLNNNIYTIDISPNQNCTTQTYSISSIYLRDTEGYESYSSDQTISALFQVASSNDFKVNVICSSEFYESVRPQITEFNVPFTEYDYSVAPSSYLIQYKIKDSSLFDPNSQEFPTVYLQDDFGNLFVLCNSSNTGPLNDYDGTFLTLICDTYQLPFGFGYPGSLLLSIYGIVDQFSNVAGYGGYSLSNSFGANTVINTKMSSAKPIISSSSSPGLINNGKNVIITIYGAFFGTQQSDFSVTINSPSDSTLVNGDGINVSPSKSRNLLGVNDLPVSVLLYTGTQIVVNADISSIVTNTVEISFSINGQTSNTYQYILPSTSVVGSSVENSDSTMDSTSGSKDVDCKALNECGGPTQGICIGKNTCTCLYGWIGISCQSKPLEGVTISVDTEKPSASLAQEGSAYKLLSLINLYQLREIDITGKVINTFDLQKKWDGKKLDTKSPEQYLFSNVIREPTTIYSTISVYTQQSSFEFADTKYQINPNSIKFTVNITSYQFKSPFNTLELIMQAKLDSSQKNNICSKKTTTLATDSDFLSVQLNEKSLYCRFLKKALVDGELKVPVEHVNKNDEFNVTLSGNSGTYFYAIELPAYKDYILIDPETKTITGADQNATCASSSNSKLSGGAIAGIVVAGVAVIVVSAIIVGSLVFRKFRFSNFTMAIRGWNSKRRSRKSSSYGLKTF
ncbi:hypothetical protein DICPUDRAFT_159154 [Dictyostelium purpureum]|uniref:EGF-like domain-containing protein n=1 Tax=Dictyostelium purpureum TaxID=5786 RepID=F1A3E9_DICPU|nr:uncharacterized protein DICPUDRAFT_159154 [Dictyostelium purpureum]EGC29284.1 hypothetical protein DICPUDRAFT_159154 [Dictyostelium purpureum]|eukprot:XP_003294194.1 hypothetical protein DICPUDRAFT_159154 [Dictyostelium purpureum]